MTDVSPMPKNDRSWQKADKVRAGQAPHNNRWAEKSIALTEETLP
jgi:hypothetical protein